MAEQVFDNRAIDKSQHWNGDKTKWWQWSQRVRGFVSGVSPKLRQMMKIAQG